MVACLVFKKFNNATSLYLPDKLSVLELVTSCRVFSKAEKQKAELQTNITRSIAPVKFLTLEENVTHTFLSDFLSRC